MNSARPISGGSVRETSDRTESASKTFTNRGWNFWAENFTPAVTKRACGKRETRTRGRLPHRRGHREHPLATGDGRR